MSVCGGERNMSRGMSGEANAIWPSGWMPAFLDKARVRGDTL